MKDKFGRIHMDATPAMPPCRLDQESWTAWSEHILMSFNQPGVKMQWEWRRGNFNPRSRTFVESSPAPKVPTMAEIMRG